MLDAVREGMKEKRSRSMSVSSGFWASLRNGEYEIMTQKPRKRSMESWPTSFPSRHTTLLRNESGKDKSAIIPILKCLPPVSRRASLEGGRQGSRAINFHENKRL